MDWSKPLSKGNYKGPSCAYCHMGGGKHQVADKSIWKFGLKQVNPLNSANSVRRDQWVELCADCHEAEWSRQQLAGLDAERKQAWSMLYEAERQLKALRSDDLLHPAADERPPYPLDAIDALIQRERIGFLKGRPPPSTTSHPSSVTTLTGESLFLRKFVLGIQAQASGKYLTRPFMPTAPRRPAFVA
ncbi:multiheme c-type cytochrome [Candidatus Reidiella endopervernicosa]|uniref:multiheme c-type cytochrome n=1 Tax=Candidatus Reidiella endopervernicosa TaxID=2738883 RepID=UPI002351A4AD|nr:multiheme c-type cytochrome [Candidatus Reidiella endopervernicosa]